VGRGEGEGGRGEKQQLIVSLKEERKREAAEGSVQNLGNGTPRRRSFSQIESAGWEAGRYRDR
jgi:hypothetical protein